MTIEDITGTFQIKGTNQDSTNLNYKGELTLTLDSTNRIEAKWLINNEQEQYGTGFFKDQILVINFNYKNEVGKVFKGVVVYKCLTKDVFEGFWSEKHGDPMFLGTEACFRIGGCTAKLN